MKKQLFIVKRVRYGELKKKVLHNLSLSSKDIKNMLDKEHLNIDDIYYALYKNKKLYIIKNNEVN